VLRQFDAITNVYNRNQVFIHKSNCVYTSVLNSIPRDSLQTNLQRWSELLFHLLFCIDLPLLFHWHFAMATFHVIDNKQRSKEIPDHLFDLNQFPDVSLAKRIALFPQSHDRALMVHADLTECPNIAFKAQSR